MTPLVAQVSTGIDWDYLSRNTGMIGDRFADHLVFTVIPVVAGLVIAFPLALLARRFRWLYTPLLQVTGVLFTIPSLAMFSLLLPFIGLGRLNAYIALTIYTLLILLRNTVEGLEGVPREAAEAADAMGFTPLQRLFKVELPIAVPTIMAGLRIATVSTIGLVTVTAFIGFGGLGNLILNEGAYRSFLTPVYVGLLLTTVLAVACDLGLQRAQRVLTPWADAQKAV